MKHLALAGAIFFLNTMGIAAAAVAGAADPDAATIKLADQLGKLSQITSYAVRWQEDYFEDRDTQRLDTYSVESAGNFMRIEYKSSSVIDGKRTVNQKWLRTFNSSTAMTLDLADKILLTAERKGAHVPGFTTPMPPFTVMVVPTLYEEKKATESLYVAQTCLDLQQLVSPISLTRVFSSGVLSNSDKRMVLTKRISKALPASLSADVSKLMYHTYKSSFSASGEFLEFTFATSLGSAPDSFVSEDIWIPKKTKRLKVNEGEITVPIEFEVTSGTLFSGDKEMTKMRYKVQIDSLEIGEQFDDDRFEIDPLYADTIYDLDAKKFIKKKK